MTRTEEQTLQALIIQFGAIATGMVALQQEVAQLRAVVDSIVPANRRLVFANGHPLGVVPEWMPKDTEVPTWTVECPACELLIRGYGDIPARIVCQRCSTEVPTYVNDGVTPPKETA